MNSMVGKISTSHMGTEKVNSVDHSGMICSISKSFPHTRLKHIPKRVAYTKLNSELLGTRLHFINDGLILTSQRSHNYDTSGVYIVPCVACSGETKECSRGQIEDVNAGVISKSDVHKTRSWGAPRKSTVGLSDACNYVYNDAKFVNERARNDIILLSRGITRLNNRARQDVEVLGNEFLKLDARARKDTEKIDSSMKKKAARLHHMATILKDRAQYELKTVADKHWSDGALEADLRRADIIARRRAMEDAFMSLKFIKDIHDMMVNKQLPKADGTFLVTDLMGCITLERNGKASDHFPGNISTDRIAAIQEAYWSMASALSEADGIDYTDPEELELVVATLIDLDAIDGKQSVSLLVECSISPDVNTRKALANALATAPSMWTLGNAGMGALQRLAEDSNPTVAAAASKAIAELQRQWELQEGDSFTFVMNQPHQRDGPNTTTE